MKSHKTKIAALFMAMTGAMLTQPTHAAPATATCLIVRHMSGNSEIAAVENWIEKVLYKTYLARNTRRDRHGILDTFIKFELLPVRGGFDLKTATSVHFAQITKEGAIWLVNTTYSQKGTCHTHNVTIRMDKGGVATVLDKGKPIGRIARFPVHEMQP